MTDRILLDTLERLERALFRTGSPLIGRLRPGVAASRLDEAEEQVGLELSRDIRDLFSWHDGTEFYPARDDFGLSLGRSGLVFPPLDRAVEKYLAEPPLLPWAPAGDVMWHRWWFPVMWGDLGTVSVSCLNGSDSTQTQIGSPADWWIYRLPGVQTLLAGIADRLESGTWRWGEHPDRGWYDLWWPEKAPSLAETPAVEQARLGISSWQVLKNGDGQLPAYDPTE